MPYFASPNTARIDPFLAALMAAAAAQQHQQQTHPQTPPPRAQKQSSPSSSSESQPTPQKKPRTATVSDKKPQNRSLRAFSPNFDVYETAEAYYLEGELPGLSDKNAIDIEFADDRNMMIRGRISRSAPKTTSEQPVEEKRRSLNPTVEDTDDEDDLGYSVVHHEEKGKQVEKSVQEEQKEERKIWLSERTFGAFQRSFSFPTPVDLDKTQATLEAGVLRIMVPKHVFQGVKRIQVM